MKVYEAERGSNEGANPGMARRNDDQPTFSTLLGDIANPPPAPPSSDAMADTRNC
jgi:hypothetical protein